MAISKTTTVDRIEVYEAEDPSADATSMQAHPRVAVFYVDTLDDPDDAELPVTAYRDKTLYKFVEDGGATTNTSGEATIVQTICSALWS
ncbi:MAG: hypothetical protein ACPGYY_09315 [Bacteroidia bacterium]